MDLERKLNSVGKQAFVENFEIFQRYATGQITKDAAIDELVQLDVSNEAGASIRVGNAKLIFDNQLVLQALGLVLESPKMPVSVIAKTKRMISHFNQNLE